MFSLSGGGHFASFFLVHVIPGSFFYMGGILMVTLSDDQCEKTGQDMQGNQYLWSNSSINAWGSICHPLDFVLG